MQGTNHSILKTCHPGKNRIYSSGTQAAAKRLVLFFPINPDCARLIFWRVCLDAQSVRQTRATGLLHRIIFFIQNYLTRLWKSAVNCLTPSGWKMHYFPQLLWCLSPSGWINVNISDFLLLTNACGSPCQKIRCAPTSDFLSFELFTLSFIPWLRFSIHYIRAQDATSSPAHQTFPYFQPHSPSGWHNNACCLIVQL